MEVFISWSKEPSKTIAAALRTWLPHLFADIAVWCSEHDIKPGQRWGPELGRRLEETDFGILCLTSTNVAEPWLLFEAGSLAKRFNEARVMPFLYGLRTADLGNGPLSQFQAVVADALGTRRLVEMLNDCRPRPLNTQQIMTVFDKWWPDLQADLSALPTPTPPPPKGELELLEQILQYVRLPSSVIRPISTAGGSSEVWQRLDEVTEAQIRQMGTPDLQRFFSAANSRRFYATDIREVDRLTELAKAAEQELVQRGGPGIAPPS